MCWMMVSGGNVFRRSGWFRPDMRAWTPGMGVVAVPVFRPVGRGEGCRLGPWPGKAATFPLPCRKRGGPSLQASPRKGFAGPGITAPGLPPGGMHPLRGFRAFCQQHCRVPRPARPGGFHSVFFPVVEPAGPICLEAPFPRGVRRRSCGRIPRRARGLP